MTKVPASTVTFLTLTQISTNPFQPRGKIQEDEAFLELVSSVQEHGVLEPLVVADTPAGYQLIAGERRWRAAKKAQLEQVPVHLIKTTPKGMLEMAMVENLQRVNLNPLEKAQGLLRLKNEFGYTTAQLAQRLSQNENNIRADLRLLKLPDPIKDALAKNQINESQAQAFLMIDSDKEMLQCFRHVMKHNLSVDKTIELARAYAKALEYLNVDDQVKKQQAVVEKWQAQIKSEFDGKTNFQLARSNKQTKVTLVFKGDKDHTKEDLTKLMQMLGIEEVDLEPAPQPVPKMKVIE